MMNWNFSLTPDFSRVSGLALIQNRFSGLPSEAETVETVLSCLFLTFTRLKPGVNESLNFGN